MYKKGDLSRPAGRGCGGGGSDSAVPPGRPLGVVSTGRHDRWHHRLSDRPPRFVTPHLARTSNSNKLECFKTALTDFEHTPRRRRRIAHVTVSGQERNFFNRTAFRVWLGSFKRLFGGRLFKFTFKQVFPIFIRLHIKPIPLPNFGVRSRPPPSPQNLPSPSLHLKNFIENESLIEVENSNYRNSIIQAAPNTFY